MATSKSSAKKAAAKKSASRQAGVAAGGKKASATASKGGAKKKASKASSTAAKKSATKAPAKRAASKKAAATDKYTDPALRERIKAKVVREGKGGRPGQWSARKAQMVAHEYEAEGGKYKGGRDETQKSLTAWGDEHWTTADGKPAERTDGMHRYLPKEAWQKLSAAEKRSTEKKKLAGDKQGKQFVANTGAAVKARRGAAKAPH